MHMNKQESGTRQECLQSNDCLSYIKLNLSIPLQEIEMEATLNMLN